MDAPRARRLHTACHAAQYPVTHRPPRADDVLRRAAPHESRFPPPPKATADAPKRSARRRAGDRTALRWQRGPLDGRVAPFAFAFANAWYTGAISLRFERRSTSLPPSAFSRGQAIESVTFTGIRHARHNEARARRWVGRRPSDEHLSRLAAPGCVAERDRTRSPGNGRGNAASLLRLCLGVPSRRAKSTRPVT